MRCAQPTGTPLPCRSDLVTSSASGLISHISPAAAEYQVPRIARFAASGLGYASSSRQTPSSGSRFPRGKPRVNVAASQSGLEQS